MRKYGYLAFDVFCISIMLLIALYLRNGLELIEEGQPNDTYILLGMTLFVSLMVLPLMNTHTRLWRYTSSVDLTAIIISVTMIVLLINGGLFLFNRLEIVPRSVPPMHWALCVVALCGSRLMARRLFGPSSRGHTSHMPNKQHVLVIGTGHIAELYIEFAKKIIAGQIAIEGLIDENPALLHRSFHQYPILGAPQDLPKIIEQFHVHGITITQLVLAEPLEKFSLASKQMLLQLERQEQIELFHFEKQFAAKPVSQSKLAFASSPSISAPASATYEKISGMYPAFKRGIDIAGALLLTTLCLPLLLLTAILVYIDVGLPLLFWQQRPGRYGTPFRLYKFRTMRPAGRRRNEDRLAHKSGDASRTSLIGKWIRRLRLDELPQLFHILWGTMSFIGPRPLLPDDQPENGQQRLSIRPGITGWAQVNGGDALSAEQKLVLDIWYIRNMSLWLDIRIALRTCIVIFQEDKARPEAVQEAQRQLEEMKPQTGTHHSAA